MKQDNTHVHENAEGKGKKVKNMHKTYKHCRDTHL